MAADDAALLAGKYQLLRPLGRGGMGEVHLAQDSRLNREVAVKFLRGDLAGDEWRLQLQQEAQLLAQLNHPNIVQIYDIVEADEGLALVMEYVPGSNLHIELRERRIDLTQKLLWLTQIADGLAASHQAGISHCDLKAENVLIGRDRLAKVTDFGIARSEPDFAGDMLALGKLAQRLLENETDLSPVVQYLLERLTDKRPGQRPDSAAAARDLRQAWHESTQAETPLPEQLAAQDKSRRRRWLPLAAATVLLVAAALFLLQAPAQLNYVAILPTVLEEPGGLSERQQQNLLATVQQALQESVIASTGLALISASDTARAQGSPGEQATALGANSLVTSVLRCSLTACDLVLQTLAGADGSVARQRSLSILSDAPLESNDSIQRQWHHLFPDTAPLAGAATLISEQDYALYLELRQAEQQNTQSFRQLLPQLEALLQRADRFLPLYHFYTHVSLGDFQLMGDAQVLERLDALLKQAETWAGTSLYLQRSRFRLAIELGEVEQAEAILARLEAAGTDELLISSLRAELHYQQREFAKAAPHYEKAVALRPSAAGMYALVRNYFFMGEAEKSLQAADALLERYPYYLPAMGVKGIILLEQGQLQQSIDVYEASLELQPDDPLARANLALAYMLNGDYEQSREQLLVAYHDDSRDPVVILNLADAEALLGNDERAAQLYQELVDRGEQQHMAVALWVTSQAYAQLGNFEQALGILKEIETLQQESPESAFSAALVYTLAGQDLTALVEVERALSSGMGPIWFQLPWFDALCSNTRFELLLLDAGGNARCPGTSD